MLKNPELNTDPVPVRRALLSVFDKTGLIEFAKTLLSCNVEILSTGGTAKALRDANITVTEVSEITGFPEIMDGRVKTINPIIEGGILGSRKQHCKEAKEHHIPWIDLVVCNLYPFADVIRKNDITPALALENVDIGGPTMIRSAAKNMGWVGVMVDPADYPAIAKEIGDEKTISYETRKRLSVKAFGHTAKYDSIIHNYFSDNFTPDNLILPFEKADQLRYGENPHQSAASYKMASFDGFSILNANVHQGKKLSYNNLMDGDGALACLREFHDPACVVVKHANPCGVAVGNEGEMHTIYQRAFNADSLSAFGGIIAMNRTCTASVAAEIATVFVEIIIAPDFEPTALEILSKKKNLRVLEMGPIPPRKSLFELRNISGGILVQNADIKTITKNELKIVTEKKPGKEQLMNMLFAWKVLKHVKSNGILIASDGATRGIGPGQVSRVDATEIAIQKAGSNAKNAVLASDAFFPFRDSIDKIAPSGVSAIIQPGGSIRDQEVIDACDEHGIAMVFTGSRCFKH